MSDDIKTIAQAVADAMVLLSRFEKQAAPLDDRDRRAAKRAADNLSTALSLIYPDRTSAAAA